jgi:hypothetical protein
MAQQARRLLRAEHTGLLSTLSTKLGGYPFGTVVNYFTDHEARPLFLISQLAEHTRNLEQDPRASFLVHEQSCDVQAGERVTLVGEACRIDTTPELKARYLRYFPASEQYFALDFGFYRIAPNTLRYIGGFGAARWLAPGDLQLPDNSLASDEADLLTRLNHSHAGDLQFLCRSYYGMGATTDAALVGIDCDGFDILADGQLLRFDFPDIVTSGAQVAAALQKMLKDNAA